MKEEESGRIDAVGIGAVTALWFGRPLGVECVEKKTRRVAVVV